MIGSVFANYQVIRKLGGGNTGVVYQGFDPMRHCFLALKILANDLLVSKEKKARFMREAKVASVLSHPAIAQVFEYGECDGAWYLAMEYVDGESFTNIVSAYPEGVDVDKFFDLMLPVVEGVAHAHEQNLVHRDLKPDNLKITKAGQPKVLDFGLVKQLDGAVSGGEESFETMAGMVVGSAGYMSPEQAQGEPLDVRTDIFSLGVIMYELLSGKNPFQGRTPFQSIVEIISSDPLSLELLRPEIPLPLCNIITRALTKDKEERYPNAASLHQAMAALMRSS